MFDNLRKPTAANLSDSEIYERAEALRQHDHHFNCTSSRPYVVTGNPEFEAFRKDWLKVMAREGDGFDS